MRTRLAALAAIFLTAHLAFFSPTLEDIDSVNFALGVRHFDVAQHQPHPPGSPVFIALAKGSTTVFHALGVRGAESRALAVWSVLAGALMLPLLVVLFDALDGNRRRAFWAAVVAALAPLAWFTASRPMSDFTGLALAVAAQALIIRAWKGRAGPASLVAGAFIAGLAAGVRVQTAALTIPVLGVALVAAPAAIPLRARLRAAGAALGGVLLWAVPLLIATGGPSNYVAALGSQAGEHFEEVVLWSTPKLRVAFHALVNSFVWPWGILALGVVVAGVAAVGALFTTIKAPKNVVALGVLFGPYAVFHLLLQETLTMRYALPLVVPIAYLFVRGASAFRMSPFAEIAVIVAGLVATVPQATAFAKGSPGFAAMGDALERGGTLSGHAGMRRLWEWVDDRSGRARFLRAPHGYEWLPLVEEWRKNPDARIQFLANPKRTDYRVLIDPQARQAAVEYRWPFVEWPHLGGARPGAVTRIEFAPPGWILDRGWAVSAEVAGVTELEGYGPHRKPSIAWVRGRDGAATLMIGGRHLGSADEPHARMTLAINGATFDEWTVKPGFFFRTVDVPASALAGTGYLPLSITAVSASADRPVRAGLEQFDLQPSGVPMAGAAEGWHEPEYNRSTGRAWRWASERAALWVRPVGRDVTLTIDAESPKRYFDSTASLRVSIGETELARLSPSEDFHWDVTLPSALLAASNGRVVLESDKWFVPGDREGTGDRRHLALRVYSFGVR